MTKSILIYVVFAFILYSCQGTQGNNKSLEGNEAIQSKILLNDIWSMTKINGEDYKDVAQKRPQLEFNHRENKFTGNDGCNQIFGNLKRLTNTHLEFDAIGATRMKCIEAKTSVQYQNLLREIRYYKIENLTLSLLDTENKALMVFKKID
ncbi:META domain-containing protein [uncultured Aquimarina sp.]|uniref:META domain-containing protein n=1 Tax=uncultured Aquimarina sp. TaxID=575652 RepID=UPI0026209598|nr:META domain-containing protein [uncultured Aquimarina sp.]